MGKDKLEWKGENEYGLNCLLFLVVQDLGGMKLNHQVGNLNK